MAEKQEILLQVFNGAAYDKWKFRLKLFLEMKNCLEVINLENRPTTITEEVWKMKEIKAKNYIVNSVSNSQLELIINENTAKGMLRVFDSIYSAKSSANKLLCKRQLLEFKMKENDDPAEFLNRFEAMVNELIGCGEVVSKDDKLNYLLLALPPSLSQIVDIIDALPDHEKSVEYVKSKLLLEQKKKESAEKYGQGASQTFNTRKEEKKCFKCGKVGHFQRECRSQVPQEMSAWRGNYNWRGNTSYRGRGQQRGRGHRGMSRGWRSGGMAGTSFVQNDTNSFNVEVMSSQVEAGYSETSDEVSWLLDSGCSDHIINNDKYFCQYRTLTDPINIKVGDGFSLKSKKIGDIVMFFNIDGQWIKTKIHNVYYVPSMKQNLLSVSSITAQNNLVVFNNDNAEVFGRKNNKIACAIKSNKLYVLKGKVGSENVNLKSCTSVAMTEKEKWHRILGHTNFYNVRKLCENNLCIGLPKQIENDYYQCEICIQNKMCNLPFNSIKTKRSTDLLQIIHTDVNGPLNPIGFGGEKYFVSFIDDFSKLAKVYCIKQKSDVYECFVDYINLVQNQTGKRIKEIRCDNGTEYLNRNFFELAKQNGIYIKPCPAYTHELNGVAERYNRTIMDRARCLLAEAKIDKYYWPECIKTAAYLGNRLLTNTWIKKTPYEIFFGRKPDVTNLKIFGSEAFVRIPEQRRTSKLNPKAEKGILVGYSDMGYRVLVGNKIIISRHVTFIEKRPQYIDLNCDEERDNEYDNIKMKTENEEKRNEHNEWEDAMDNETQENEDEDMENIKEVTQGRPKRNKKLPERYNDYVVNANYCNVNIPENYEQAIKSLDSKKWRKAMDEELKSLEENNTWKVVHEPSDKKIIEVKWIYRIKSNGKYKARVVAKGFQQIYSEHEEIYSPVARMTTLKVLLSTACLNGWEIEQMDVETAFLNGNIKSEVYIYPPDGYEIEDGKVYLLNKSLYGLRESPRDWYECFHNYMEKINFKRSDYDYCLYTGCIKGEKVYVILYVDDLLLMGLNNECIKEVKDMLNKKFRMKDLGRIKQYLGINIEYQKDERKMYLSQEEYIENLSLKYQVSNSKGYETPMEINLKLEPADKVNENLKYRNLIGALLYVANGTRPDISFSVNYLSRFQNSYNETHYKYALRILKYLYTTKSLKLNYDTNYENIMEAYVDADWASDIIDRKSTTGIIIKVFGNTVLWKSQKQKIVSRASTHAEYYALADCVEEVLPIKGVLSDIGVVINCIKIYEDNTGAIALSKNGKFCKNSKHIDISYHFVHDFEKKGIINVCKIHTEDQIADILTKSLCKVKFQKLRQLLGVQFCKESAHK